MSDTTVPTVTMQDFVPEEEWPRVSVMLEGFGAPSLPDSDALVGQDLTIDQDVAPAVQLRFLSMNRLVRSVEGDDGESEHPYRAVEVRPSIFYVDILAGESVATHDISLVIDLTDGRVTTADTYFVDRDGRVRTTTDFISGRVRGTGPMVPRERTDALVGKRVYYRYSDVEAYEHVYLNPGTFVWQCVKGGEKGLADVEQCKTFELADDLVIFFWTETVMPVDSFLVIDLKAQRSIGRMFCWDAPALGTVHLPFDSRFTVLNETRYPED